MGLQVLGTDKIIRLNDFTLNGLVQSEDWAPAFNALDIMEMGNQTRVDTAMELETSGSMDLVSAGNLAGFLARWIVVRTPVTNAVVGWLYDPAGGSAKNAYTLTQANFAEAYADILIHERTSQTTYDRSVWIPRCFLTGFSGKIDAQGIGSESVKWMGSDVVVFKTPYHDIRSVGGLVTSSTVVALTDITVDSATSSLAYVYVNEKRYRNGTSGDTTTFVIGTAGTVGKLTMTTSVGVVLLATDVVRAVIYKTTPGTVFPQLATVDRGTTARYVKAHKANIYLAPAVDANDDPTGLLSTDFWLKVQSCDFNVDFRMDELHQIAYSNAGSTLYARVPTYPINVSCNVSVIESDFADWKKMLTKTSGTVYMDSLDWNPDTLKQKFSVVIEYWTKTGLKVQEMGMGDMRIDSVANRAAIGGRGEVSFSMKGTKFRLMGFNV
jgi:hypothetical protein